MVLGTTPALLEGGQKENDPGENGVASIDIVAAAGESFFAASRLTHIQTPFGERRWKKYCAPERNYHWTQKGV